MSLMVHGCSAGGHGRSNEWVLASLIVGGYLALMQHRSSGSYDARSVSLWLLWELRPARRANGPT